MAFYSVFESVFMLFAIMAVGFLIYKIKMVNQNTITTMTSVLFDVVTPCLIVSAFQIEVTEELAVGAVTMFALAAGSFIFTIPLAKLIYLSKKIKPEHAMVLKFAAVYSNCGFMGLPLIQAVLGEIGVFYASIFLAMFNLFLWTHGVILYTGRLTFENAKKIATNPTIIAVAIGALLFAFRLSFPALIAKPIDLIASLNSPLSMLIIGATIASTRLKHIFLQKQAYWCALIRNILFPALFTGMVYFIGIRGPLLVTSAALVACPCAGATVIFANKFHGDTQLAASCMTVSTVLSLITLPLVINAVSMLQ